MCKLWAMKRLFEMCKVYRGDVYLEVYSLLQPYPINSTSIQRSYIYVGFIYCYCTDLREIKRIVDDHLNIKVYQYIFLVFFFFFTFFYIYFHHFTIRYQHELLPNLWKGSCPSIVLQSLKIICVVLSTHCKFFFLRN